MSAIENYQQAVSEIQAAIHEAERMVQIVSSGAALLRNNWKRTMMSNVDGGFPAEIALSSKSFNGREWPTGQQLADVLVRYHNACRNLQNAYRAIPDSQRAVVQEPEEFI